MNERLQTALKQLRLSGLAQSLDVRFEEATSHQLSHAEFLELILQDELLVRRERLIARRVKAASFRELKPLDQFDWSFNPKIPKKQILIESHSSLLPGFLASLNSLVQDFKKDTNPTFPTPNISLHFTFIEF